MQNKELVRMYAYLPAKLSELSKVDHEAAIKILQDWGAGKKSIRQLWNEIHEALEGSNNEDT